MTEWAMFTRANIEGQGGASGQVNQEALDLLRQCGDMARNGQTGPMTSRQVTGYNQTGAVDIAKSTPSVTCMFDGSVAAALPDGRTVAIHPASKHLVENFDRDEKRMSMKMSSDRPTITILDKSGKTIVALE